MGKLFAGINFNISWGFIFADELFLKNSQTSTCKTAYDFCYKKKRFQRKKRFFVYVNDLLQVIECPLDHEMH